MNEPENFDTLPPEWQDYITRMEHAYNTWQTYLADRKKCATDAIAAIETLATVTKGDASDYLALRRADLHEIEALLALTTVPPINEKTP